MELFDTHCHLDVADFDHDRSQVLANARQAGVHGFVIPGIQRSSWQKLCRFCATADDLYPALGLHPVYIDSHRDGDIEDLPVWIEREKPVAVGEIGLDFHDKHQDKAKQLRLLQAQLEIASSFDLPVLLHVRKAHDQVLQALAAAGSRKGICHAFNGSLQQAEKYIERGFKLGFGGMLTFERSSRLRKLAAGLPLQAIVLETDAPDLTVASHQYQRNSPEYLPEILTALSSIRPEADADIASQTTKNARDVLTCILHEGGQSEPGFR